MSEQLDRIVADIDGLVAHHKSELQRLLAARTALVGGANLPEVEIEAPTPPAADGRPGRRAPRGLRSAQVLDHIAEHPGCTVKHLAEVLGITESHAESVTRRLSEGRHIKVVRRAGQSKTFRMADNPPPAKRVMRVSSGKRLELVADYVAQHPSATAPEIAEAQGITSQATQSALKRLVDKGRIEKVRRHSAGRNQPRFGYRKAQQVRLGAQGMAPRAEESEHFRNGELAHRTEAGDRELTGTPA